MILRFFKLTYLNVLWDCERKTGLVLLVRVEVGGGLVNSESSLETVGFLGRMSSRQINLCVSLF